jgi:hypothetical protein
MEGKRMKFFRLNKKVAELERHTCDLEKRLYEMQTTVEVQSDALNQKDVALMEFVHKLHETMGGEKKLTCEEDALARLRVLRDQSDRYLAIRSVIRGDYDAEEALLKRLACSLGCSQFDVENVIKRAGVLAGVLSENVGLKHELRNSKDLIEELEDELYGEE